MGLTPQQIAEAFSSHRFDVTYEHLADDVEWNVVGNQPIVGRDGVVGACQESAEYLATVTTTFTRFRTVATDDCVVVDTLAEYTDDENDATTVASCDIYDFTAGRVSAITSYNIELA